MRRCNGKKLVNETKKVAFVHLRYRLREGCLILAVAFSAFLLIALLSYQRSDPAWSHSIIVKAVANAGGRAGALVSDIILYTVGYLAYAFPFMISFVAWICFRNRHEQDRDPAIKFSLIGLRFVGFLLILLAASTLTSLYLPEFSPHLPFNAGGIAGTVVAHALLPIFNSMGTTLISIASLLIGSTLFTGLSWLQILELLGGMVIKLTRWCVIRLREISWGNPFQCLLPADHLREIVTVRKIQKIESDLPLDPEIKSVKLKIAEPPKLDIVDSDFIKTPYFKGLAVVPKLSLLDKPLRDHISNYSEEELQRKSKDVELRLADFGIRAKVVAVHPGPVVTRFELQLAAGTKVSRVTNLAKDLARSLSVISVRIVEVIPGKSVIGLELPNKHREVVTIYEVLATKQYQNARSSLTLALGKDIGGHPVIVDLAKMPHLLAAGTTGSGKSVSLNAMLLSLLYKATPKQLRLILIDPKMLELSVYEGIPHLLTPVVTDMRDAASALRWCVSEMERRYHRMASLGVRHILGYNAKVKAACEEAALLSDSLRNWQKELPEMQELPQIVIIADEFADMMLVVGKKVETLIVRLAQKARAAGIHLIFATQRPSVDVITGLIKANIPTRIAFQVSSKIDSRTILDQQGAEQLLGYGDSLYLAPGTGIPVRVHVPYVRDEEVHRVAEYLKSCSEPDYVEGILDEMSAQDASSFTEAGLCGGPNEGERDPLYDQAVEVVIRARRVSVSSIQRRFKVGYNRASRIVEAMEAAGVVSPMENNGTREVLIPSQE